MQPGEVLDARFRVERHLGAGSAAQVYRALDLATGETVALKVVRDSEGELADRFQREIEILRDLTHPALPRHVAGGTTPQGHLYAALEWLPGEDLRMRLHRGRLTAYESIEIVRRVAEGLAVAHARGVVHRDVKPSNVFLVDGDVERVKVIDFGMARASSLEGVGLATEHGMILGARRRTWRPSRPARPATPTRGPTCSRSGVCVRVPHADRELRLLAGTFEECVDDGVARAMLLTGATGVVKSRVRYEFLLGCMARADVWQGAGRSIACRIPARAARRSAAPGPGHPRARRAPDDHRAHARPPRS